MNAGAEGPSDAAPAGEGAPKPRFQWRLALPEPEPAEGAEAREPTPEPLAEGAPLGERRIGPYLLGETLGKGGQGAVYRARDLRVDRWVALKVLGDARAAAAARFRREAEATAALRHPGIVRVHDAGEAGGSRYVAYELIEGARDLSDLLEEAPSPERVAGWVAEVAAALQVAHARGIVHRDLKPQNLLVDEAGRLRVADFGLARLSEGTRLTETLAAVGTPLYMSPEQVRGEREVGPQADVWALGVILYEGFTGERPFLAATLAELSVQIVSSEVRSPRLLAPTLSPALAQVCLRCLARDPAQRYPDAAALGRALAAALRAKPPGRALPALILLGAAALALALAWPRGPAPSPPPPPDASLLTGYVARGELAAADALAARLEPGPLRLAWEARLQSERGASLGDVESGLLQAGVHPAVAGQVAALCSLRGAARRGERPWQALRELRRRWPQSRSLAAAEAELLLDAARPLEACELLGRFPRSSAEVQGLLAAGEWSDRAALHDALDGLITQPPQLAGLAGAPPAWRAGAARWLFREVEALTWRALRALESPHLPQGAGDPRARAAALLELATPLLLEVDPAQVALLRGALGGQAEAPSAAAEGSLAAAAVRAAARRARASGSPALALALLGRIEGASADPWRRARAGALATAWLEGELLLDLGRPQDARALLQERAALLPAACETLVRAAEACGDPAGAAAARARAALLAGAEREEGDRRATHVRGKHRGGMIPPKLLDPVFEVDPLSPLGHFSLARARFVRGGGGLEEMLLHGETWPRFLVSFHRHVFGMWIGDLSMGHLKRDLLGDALVDLSPLQREVVESLFLEIRGGGSTAALARLDRLEAVLEEAPGALAPRQARAFLRLRAGYPQAAARDLDWLERESPRLALALYYRALAQGAAGASAATLVSALREAMRAGFQTWRAQAWDPQAYPELAPQLGSRALDEFLRREVGWTGAKGF